MHGLRLAEMDVSDMLDVFHFILEDDMNYVNAEQAQTRSDARSLIYKSLYMTEYKYGTASKSSGSSTQYVSANDGSYDDLDIEPFDPVKTPTKPYVPPTDFDGSSPLPFGKVLDGPLN